VAADYTALTWTAAELLADVYRACRLPATGTVDYTPDVVLRMATQSLHDWAGHMLSTAHEGRLVTSFLRTMPTDALDRQGAVYELPPLAAADTIDALIWVDPVSNVETRLETVPPAMLPLFTRGYETGSPHGYAFMDGAVRLFPTPSSTGTLKMLYQRRHGALTNTPEADYAVPTAAIAAGSPVGATTQLTFATLPTRFALGSWVDIVQSTVPHRTRAHGVKIASLAPPTIQLNLPFEDYTRLVAGGGDTVVAYGKAPFCQLPLEMRDPFNRQVAARLLSEIGDLPISMAQDQLSGQGAIRVRDMLSPRAKGQPQKLYNPNSLARGGSETRRRWSGT
jgi:hypothetical protein